MNTNVSQEQSLFVRPYFKPVMADLRRPRWASETVGARFDLAAYARFNCPRCHSVYGCSFEWLMWNEFVFRAGFRKRRWRKSRSIIGRRGESAEAESASGKDAPGSDPATATLGVDYSRVPRCVTGLLSLSQTADNASTTEFTSAHINLDLSNTLI